MSPIKPPSRASRAAAAVLALVCLAVLASPAGGAVVERSRPAGGALAHWTPQRMATAEPRELRRAPTPRLLRRAAAARALPGAFGSYEILDFATPPYSANGKIFASDRRGDFQCSGTVVSAANESVLLTAGHCLHLRGSGWARNLVFVPSYHDGAQPFGLWSARAALVKRKWLRRQAPAFDFGAVVIAPSPTATLQATVGSYPLAPDRPRRQAYRVAGYPVNYFGGERMMGCYGPFVGVDWRTGSTGIRCDLGQGSSGGGWIVADAYLVSVMSYGLRGRSDLAFGPRLRGSASRLVARAGGL